MDADPSRTQGFIARALKVKQPSVSAWVLGNDRPSPRNRQLLQDLSHGEILVRDWDTDEEIVAFERARAEVMAPKTGS